MTRIIAALILAAALPACSLGTRGAHAMSALRCPSSRIAPIADTAAALAGAGTMGYGFSQGLTDEPGGHRSAIIGGGFAGALVFATSAIVGYTWAGDCRSAGAVEARRTAHR